MKNLIRSSILILAAGCFAAFAHAQAGSVAKAIVESSEKSLASASAAQLTGAAAQNALRSTIVLGAAPNVTVNVPTSTDLVPLAFYDVSLVKINNPMDWGDLNRQVQIALKSADSSANQKFLTPTEKNTLEQLEQFIQTTNRFPEQHFGEDMRIFSQQEEFDIATESALRKQIDELVVRNPRSDFAKDIFALHTQYAEKQILSLEKVLQQISPSAETFPALKNTGKTPSGAVLVLSSELPNTYKLTDNLYRGAQPTDEGYKILAKMGIKTIISFRTHKPNKELIESLGMESVHIPLNPALITPAQMARFLQLVSDPEHQPVFIHCRHGSDRTGTMVAAYRMVIQKWSKQDALTEMKNPDFGFHRLFFTLPPIIKYTNVGKIESKMQK